MYKKIIVGMLCIMLSFMFVGCGVSGPIYQQTTEGDYLVNIYASNGSFKQGDSIEIVVIIQNNSGQDQPIYEGMLLVNLFGGKSTFKHNCFDQAELGNHTSYTLPQGETIIKKTIGNKIGSIYRRGKHRLVAETNFRIETDESFSSTIVYSNTIYLIVK